MDEFDLGPDVVPIEGTTGEAPRFIFCFDFGTTFTGVAWALVNGTSPPRLRDIQVVSAWASDYIQDKVPSLYTYSPEHGQRWGWDIENNMYVIRQPKLELPEPKTLDALKKLKCAVKYDRILREAIENGTRLPIHVTKGPYDVIKDYLLEVAKAAHDSVEKNLPPGQLKDFPIDIVVTHPAEWDERARNMTFKAVHAAFKYGFRDSKLGTSRMTTEPEACAQYTLEAAQSEGIMDIREGECFVVVDAGGGTVDLVSYYVQSLSPFQPKRVTRPSGGKCGATCIDRYFLFEYLPAKLGAEYDALAPGVLEARDQDQSGGQVVLSTGLQSILKEFQLIKHEFEGRKARGQAGDIKVLNLPHGFGNRNDTTRGIRDGQLLISSADLEIMFQESVPEILRLIEGQLAAVGNKHMQAKAIFLSGGFSGSKYLRDCVEQFARSRDVGFYWPEKESWSAVARGGVVMGFSSSGEYRQAPICHQSPCHIGVVLAEPFATFSHEPDQRYIDTHDGKARAKNNIKWLVLKGDLIENELYVKQRIVRKLPKRMNPASRLTVVFDTWDYIGEHANEPPTNLHETPGRTIERIGAGRREAKKWDFQLPQPKQNQWKAAGNSSGWFQLDMDLEITVTKDRASIQLTPTRRAEYGEPEEPLLNESHVFNPRAAEDGFM
ncbi:hypothetical protein CDV31_004408 [Fusarium ambrosium]|uniref:Uncharacterized protein n=1 Tax=Fusarium ambrosium TaxID=131363 RepID=A0A428UR99_9HYPO|nr:hypothetical protein CDV31_004408 [Fusarium ambrosium]